MLSFAFYFFWFLLMFLVSLLLGCLVAYEVHLKNIHLWKKYEQIKFNNTLKESYTTIKWDLFQGCKDGSTFKTINMIPGINKMKNTKEITWISQQIQKSIEQNSTPIHNKNGIFFFTEVDQIFLKIEWNHKGSCIAKTILRKKNKAVGIMYPAFTLY